MVEERGTSAPVELALGGLHCAGCVTSVESALLRVPGVRRAAVNLATSRATVWLDAGPTQPPTPALLDAVRHAGYQARLAADTVPDDRAVALRRERRRLLLDRKSVV